jgi:hypothetical protein
MPSLIDSQVVQISQIAPGYLKVVLDNPPFNLVDSRVFSGLRGLQEYVEDPSHGVKVVLDPLRRSHRTQDRQLRRHRARAARDVSKRIRARIVDGQADA